MNNFYNLQISKVKCCQILPRFPAEWASHHQTSSYCDWICMTVRKIGIHTSKAKFSLPALENKTVFDCKSNYTTPYLHVNGKRATLNNNDTDTKPKPNLTQKTATGTVPRLCCPVHHSSTSNRGKLAKIAPARVTHNNSYRQWYLQAIHNAGYTQ